MPASVGRVHHGRRTGVAGNWVHYPKDAQEGNTAPRHGSNTRLYPEKVRNNAIIQPSGAIG